ncbi:MAG: hypothetical protein NZ560_06595 [Aquificaceae bacterium]|nr:hypothetical protein [Aquificaceae bacterium]MDW8097685.1 hypothetical protein [Aquificaceae bacterium]
MSVRVEGVIDLPHVDLADTEGLYETFLFLREHRLCKELQDYAAEYAPNRVRLTHVRRAWSYVEFIDGKVCWDEHYKQTVKEKDAILKALREYYPMVKKATEILKTVGSGKLSYDKEKECIVLEVEE